MILGERDLEIERWSMCACMCVSKREKDEGRVEVRERERVKEGKPIVETCLMQSSHSFALIQKYIFPFILVLLISTCTVSLLTFLLFHVMLFVFSLLHRVSLLQ